MLVYNEQFITQYAGMNIKLLPHCVMKISAFPLIKELLTVEVASKMADDTV
jgi:hypothetical protein